MSERKRKITKKTVFLILFILLNVGVILWTALDEFSDTSNAVKLRDLQVQGLMLIPAAGCWLAAILAEVVKYMAVMHRLGEKPSLHLCARTVLLGRYYDNVTPSGIGGQPFQILYLTQNGISGSHATVTTMSAFLSMQFGFVLLALITFLSPWGDTQADVLRVTRYIGLVFYAFFPLVILGFTFLPKQCGAMLAWFARVGHRMHLVKDREKAEQSVRSAISTYSSTIRSVLAAPGLTLCMLLLGVLYHAALCCIPYFVIHAYGGGMSFMECFVNTLSIYAAITFIPTPGNGGAAEGSFYLVFSMLTTGYTFWAMLTWRFFTYYVFILFGLLIYLEKFIRSRRARKASDA